MAYTTINKSTDYFETLLSTGDDGSQTFTGLDFQPDFVWSKRRQTHAHQLYDSVRTAGSGKALQSDATAAEGGDGGTYGYLSSFTSDGFASTAGSSNNNYFNASGGTYAFWNWKAGTTSGIVQGGASITPSAYSFNQTSGFSIIKYQGTGANATVPHGLNAVPKMILFKSLANSISWIVYSSELNISSSNCLRLNGTNAPFTESAWNGTRPTTSVFSLGTHNEANNNSGETIAYCFADIQGYSKFSSYTGNGNADGTFVYTGFKPAWVMVKKYSSTSGWYINDTARDPFNGTYGNDASLFANTNGAEFTSASLNVDMLSNGFKLRSNNSEVNGDTYTYIYMAFAEAPLVGSNGVTAKAR